MGCCLWDHTELDTTEATQQQQQQQQAPQNVNKDTINSANKTKMNEFIKLCETT